MGSFLYYSGHKPFQPLVPRTMAYGRGQTHRAVKCPFTSWRAGRAEEGTKHLWIRIWEPHRPSCPKEPTLFSQLLAQLPSITFPAFNLCTFFQGRTWKHQASTDSSEFSALVKLPLETLLGRNSETILAGRTERRDSQWLKNRQTKKCHIPCTFKNYSMCFYSQVHAKHLLCLKGVFLT